MAKIKLMHNIVLEVLEENKNARGDDYILINEVLTRIGFNTSLPIETVLRNHTALKLPSFETITRCRRKIQQEHPELVNEGAKSIRAEEAKEFKAYSKE